MIPLRNGGTTYLVLLEMGYLLFVRVLGSGAAVYPRLGKLNNME